jgi:hypothetical protein
VVHPTAEPLVSDEPDVKVVYYPERFPDARQATFEGEVYVVDYEYLARTFGGRDQWLRIASDLAQKVKSIVRELGSLDNPQHAAYYIKDSCFPNSIFIEDEGSRVVVKDWGAVSFDPCEEDLVKVGAANG